MEQERHHPQRPWFRSRSSASDLGAVAPAPQDAERCNVLPQRRIGVKHRRQCGMFLATLHGVKPSRVRFEFFTNAVPKIGAAEPPE